MKTELELNTELAELLGMRVATIDDMPYKPFCGRTREEVYQNYLERYPNTVWALPDDGCWEQFVFTRDWSQLMPIVVKLGVEYTKCSYRIGEYIAYHRTQHGTSNIYHSETLPIALVKSCISVLKGKV